MQNELHSYMSRLSELQLHKENLEASLTNQLKASEEKVGASNAIIQEKDSQVEIRPKMRIEFLNSCLIFALLLRYKVLEIN